MTMPLPLDGTTPCDVCGDACLPPATRCCCSRCHHKLADHSDQLDCRSCARACGIDASRTYR